MSVHGILGLFLVACCVAGFAAVLSRARVGRVAKRLLLVGLALRVAGSLAYLTLIGEYYGGGDYLIYFNEGWLLAESSFRGGPYSIWDPAIWTEDVWWGTTFVTRVTSLLLMVIGPTLSGAFIVFSLLSYIGIVSLGVACQRAFPNVSLEKYYIWIALFPSLWFWPTALGKDALVLCGVGLATLGFVGVRERPRLGFVLLGVGLVFCIRPQVAATLVFSFGAAQWLGVGMRWTPRRILQGVVFAVVGVSVLSMAGGTLDVELFSPDEVETYLDEKAALSARGGSAVSGEEQGVNPWLAPITTLFRPFPWEARGITALIASAEIVVLWGFAWRRRRQVKAFIATYRRTRLFWLAVVFVAVYATALGMSLSNLGIVARQRVHILPFLFLFFSGGGGVGQRRQEAPRAPLRRRTGR